MLKPMRAVEIYRLLLENPTAFGLDPELIEWKDGVPAIGLTQGRSKGQFMLFTELPPICEDLGLKIAQIEQRLENVVDDPNDSMRKGTAFGVAKLCLNKIQKIYINYSQMKNRLAWFQKNLLRLASDIIYLDTVLTKQHQMFIDLKNEFDALHVTAEKLSDLNEEFEERYKHLRSICDPNVLLQHDIQHGNVALSEGALLN